MASSVRKEFDAAFRSALDAGESTFEFQGKKYNTKMAPPKTESNRGGARMKSGTDIMDTLPKVGKVKTSELPSVIPPVTPQPKLPGKSPDKEQYLKAQEAYKSDLVGEMAMKKGGKVDFSQIIRNKKTGVLSMKKAEGGMVKAKRTSNRGAGIAVKGFGRAGGR
jgi:hypothetical protein